MTKSKEWTHFLPFPIRLQGTRKTTHNPNILELPANNRQVKTGNCLDTVKGCLGGKTNEGHGCWWGCYSKHAMNRAKKFFNQPVSQTLIKELLLKDLDETTHTWVRIGLHGDPSLDWELTIKTCEVINSCKKLTVLLTRFWKLPTKKQLKRLAKMNVHLHGTMCALDNDSFIEPRYKILRQFIKLGGVSRLRFVTFAFKDEIIRIRQNVFCKSKADVLVQEQPANVRKSNPIWSQLDHKRYLPHKSYDTKRFSGWYSAGSLYDLNHCANPCWQCEHQCMTQT